jgi:nucleotide-binding universal stress UspA family protein
VRGDPGPAAPVVAGVDDSAEATTVLAFAAGQAAARKVPLHVIHAWKPVTGLWERTPMDAHLVTAGEREPFDNLVTLIRDTYPDLEVEAEAVVEHPAGALTRAGASAQLLVVGVSGRGPWRGLLMGSVSQHVVRHADCPVAVVHDLMDEIQS